MSNYLKPISLLVLSGVLGGLGYFVSSYGVIQVVAFFVFLYAAQIIIATYLGYKKQETVPVPNPNHIGGPAALAAIIAVVIFIALWAIVIISMDMTY